MGGNTILTATNDKESQYISDKFYGMIMGEFYEQDSRMYRSNNITIKDMVLDANTHKIIGIRLIGNLCTIENVTAKKSNYHGFLLNKPIDTTIKDCEAYNNTYAGFYICTGANEDENIHIKNCESNNNDYGYRIDQTDSKDIRTAIGYVISNSTASGNNFDFYGDKAHDVTVENCTSGSAKVYNVMRFVDNSRRIHVVNFNAPNAKFDDIENNTENINWGLRNGLLTANEDNLFNQDGVRNLSRAHAITMLYRMEHYNISEDVSYDPEISFTDHISSYLKDAIYWGEHTPDTTSPIIKGTEENESFSGDEDCRIMDFLTWIYRLEGKPTTTRDTAYFESSSSDSYANSAINWAVEVGLCEDATAEEFKGPIVKEKALEILKNYCENLYKSNNYRQHQKRNGTNVTNNVDITTNGTNNGVYPTRTGYIFEGWTGSNGIEPVKDIDVTDGADVLSGRDYVYTANWTKNEEQIPVRFETNGGSAIDTQYVDIGGKATDPGDPTREGYTFGAWCKDSELTTEFDFETETITAPTTIYAKWIPIAQPTEYTVTFETNGGSEVDSQTVENGGKATEPSTAPTKEGYTFVDWYADEGLTTPFDFNTPITGNITIYAKWTENQEDPGENPTTYTVTFDTNGGSAVQPQQVNDGEKATEPEDPTKDGNTFAGWFIDSEFTTEFDFDTPISGPIIIYAKWTENQEDPGETPTTYTVTFETNEGSTVSPQTVESGEKATMPTNPTKNGYIFGGWYANSELTTTFDFDTPITKDTTIYAKWIDNSDEPGVIIYTATFDANGGEPDESTITVGEGVPLGKLPEPTRDGYTFKGWFDEDGEEAKETTVLTSDKTYYARWEENQGEPEKEKYEISFNVDGEIVDKNTIDAGDNVGTLPSSPTKDGYTFKGWYTSPTGGIKITEDTIPTGDTTYYAQWEADSQDSENNSTNNGGSSSTNSGTTNSTNTPSKGTLAGTVLPYTGSKTGILLAIPVLGIIALFVNKKYKKLKDVK